MLKDITLGQFFPGDTVIHRLDPRAKLIITLAFIVELFFVNSMEGYLLMLVFLIAVTRTARISGKMVLKSVKPLIFIILFTAILNLFYTSGTPLVTLGFLTISREGVLVAVHMALRIIFLVVGTSLLTYTTSPIALTDGLEQLLGPLKKIHVPVHEISMMMTIALRFIPTLLEETDKIMNAQKARGADFESGNLISRAKALVPILVPLFVSAFRRADELAVAMECRCYTGGEGRTKMKSLKMGGIDLWGLLLIAAFAPLIYLLNRYAFLGL